MTNQSERPVIQRLLEETTQSPETRQPIFAQLRHELKRPVVSYFSSFQFPGGIEDTDADMLEGVLQKLDSKAGLALLINSPGGDGLAAERIVKICRTYSGTGEYWAIVPGKAKSAATMICFGASKIIMGPTSELGAVDPQLSLVEDDQTRWFSARNVVASYETLFERAVAEKGRLEPYLQQLANYDEREIQELRSTIALSEDIAVRILHSGMMQTEDLDSIRNKIRMFLAPEETETKTHGRAIYRDEASCCGLNTESADARSKLWQLVYELYIRTNHFVSTRASKCIESEHHSFAAAVPGRKE